MEIPLIVLYPSIMLISLVIISPRIHTGFVCTIGLSVIALGLLGLALQENEVGSLHYGVRGQWQAIKIGAVISLVGLALNLMKRKSITTSKPRELEKHELPQVRGRGPE